MKNFILIYSYKIDGEQEQETGRFETKQELLNGLNAIAQRRDATDFKIVFAAEIKEELEFVNRTIIINRDR